MFIFLFRPVWLVWRYQKVIVRFCTLMVFPNRTDNVAGSWSMQFLECMLTRLSTVISLWCSEGISSTDRYHPPEYFYLNLKMEARGTSSRRFSHCYSVLNFRNMYADVRRGLRRYTTRHRYVLLCCELCQNNGCYWLWECLWNVKLFLCVSTTPWWRMGNGDNVTLRTQH
jgi:hypothetical protein